MGSQPILSLRLSLLCPLPSTLLSLSHLSLLFAHSFLFPQPRRRLPHVQFPRHYSETTLAVFGLFLQSYNESQCR